MSKNWYNVIETGALQIFKCPSQKDPFWLNFYLRYGINTINSSSYNATFTELQNARRVINFRRPYSLIHIADTMDNVPAAVTLENRIELRRYHGSRGVAGMIAAPWINAAGGYNWLVGDRHNVGSNVLFFDGNVIQVSYYDLMFADEDTEADRSTKERLWDHRK